MRARGVMPDGTRCDDVRGALVHIALSGVQDANARERLQSIPTGLTIPDADVDTLLYWGERLVRENTVIRDLISAPAAAGDLAGPRTLGQTAAGPSGAKRGEVGYFQETTWASAPRLGIRP
jgi:hypothetical protein